MASKTVVLLEDDIDGSKADETVKFAVDNVTYEIDLSSKHADEFRKAVQPFVDAARRTAAAAKRQKANHVSNYGNVENRAVRAWAAANGVSVSSRGRIAADVVEKYRAAGH